VIGVPLSAVGGGEASGYHWEAAAGTGEGGVDREAKRSICRIQMQVFMHAAHTGKECSTLLHCAVLYHRVPWTPNLGMAF